jgi:hypothetical protein
MLNMSKDLSLISNTKKQNKTKQNPKKNLLEGSDRYSRASRGLLTPAFTCWNTTLRSSWHPELLNGKPGEERGPDIPVAPAEPSEWSPGQLTHQCPVVAWVSSGETSTTLGIGRKEKRLGEPLSFRMVCYAENHNWYCSQFLETSPLPSPNLHTRAHAFSRIPLAGQSKSAATSLSRWPFYPMLKTTFAVGWPIRALWSISGFESRLILQFISRY